MAYQGLHPELGYYDDYRPWEGLLAKLTIQNGAVVHIEFTPLDLDEGETYRAEYDAVGFLSRRGLAEVATGELADSILDRFRDLSAKYGTELVIVSADQRAQFGTSNAIGDGPEAVPFAPAVASAAREG